MASMTPSEVIKVFEGRIALAEQCGYADEIADYNEEYSGSYGFRRKAEPNSKKT